MKSVSTHEMNGGQRQLILAVSALFGAKQASLRPNLNYLSLHFANLLHVLIYLLLALLNNLVLLFQPGEQILSQNLEFKFLLCLDNLKYE